jgi:hypothetical protein
LVFADESGEPLRDSARIDAVVDPDGGTPVACCCRLTQFSLPVVLVT